MGKDEVSAQFRKESIDTYAPKQESDLPFFFEKKPYQGASGKLYPLRFSDGMADKKKAKTYNVGVLENHYLRVEVLPEIGGKVLRGYDKVGSYDFIYHNSVVKPAMIGLGGAWISGGIEFNWPQHHRPTTFMPVSSTITENEHGEKTIWMGEIEPFQDMAGMVGISLCPGRSFLKATVKVSNNTPFAHPFMWWSNLAVPINDNYQIVFPPDVEWVNDHDRRAVLSWPVAKGIYHTARPFDYGKGTDISFVKRIPVPSSFMVSEGQSDMDFVSGYDHGKEKGIVSVGDHTVVTGKKLWSWGSGAFGEMWCSNLTDTDGQYAELMTGAYTDNQPDFTWIQSGETKTFEQYWYPIHDIGAVKNASRDAAINVEKRDDGLFIGIDATGAFPDSTLHMMKDGKECMTVPCSLSPEKSFLHCIPWQEGWRLSDFQFLVVDREGNDLVSYREMERGKKEPIAVRLPVQKPSEIASVEELFLNGLHLEQYKQHSYNPRDYYLEGLRRDALDVRCNTAMARLCLKDGRFEESVAYAETAEVRLLSRNAHPEDCEVCYLHGIALVYLHRDEEARRWFSKSAWSALFAGPSFFQIALLELRKKHMQKALAYLEQARSKLPDDTSVAFVLSTVFRKLGHQEESVALCRKMLASFPLDFGLRWELVRSGAEEKIGITAENKDILPWIFLYQEAGCTDECVRLVSSLPEDTIMKRIYLAWFLQKPLDVSGNPEIEFPSHLADFGILSHMDGAFPAYLYGCLLYDRCNVDGAVSAWESCIHRDPAFAYAYRNLAFAFFDKKHDEKGAEKAMEKAFALRPDNPRILYEYQQLLKNKGTDNATRLSLYESHRTLMAQRDDCVLDYSILLTYEGRYGEAEDVLEGRTFHIYEGGEGKITQHHAWLHLLHALSLMESKQYTEAETHLEKALVIPPSYGEAKSYFAQEGHVYYFLAVLEKLVGKEYRESLVKAAEPKSAVSPLSLFRALALQELEHWSEAEAILQEMVAVADDQLRNLDRYPYYGVGAPTPMPFELDIKKRNTISGSLLKAYALYGLGREEEAGHALEPVREKDPWNFMLHAYEMVRHYLGRKGSGF